MASAAAVSSSDAVAPRTADLLAVALLGFILFFPFLGRRDFWTSREARVAQVARQMRESADPRAWIVPRLGGEERLKKPPLAYWLTALASMPWQDVDEFNSRLPNAAAGVGILLLTYLFGLRLYGRSAGLLASLMLGTMPDIWLEARTTGIEAPLLFFNLLALYAWWRYHDALPLRGAFSAWAGERRWLFLCYFALGLSFLQKGPVGPTVVLLIAAIYAWGFDRRSFDWRGHLQGLALFLLLAVPWPLAVWLSEPGAWDIWHQEFFGRLKGRDHIEPWHYFLGVVLGQGQPWVLLALAAPWFLGSAANGPGQVGSSKPSQRFFPGVWAIAVFVFFSLPASKQSYYILLIYPSLALLAAAFLQMAEEKKSPGAWAKRFFWFAALAVFVASGLLLFLAAAKPSAALSGSLAKRLAILDAIGAPWRQYGWRAAWALAILAVAMAKCARQRPALAAGFLAAAVATGFALFIALVPFLNRHKSDRGLCQRLAPLLEPGDRVFNYATPGVPTLTYYLRREVERLEKPLQVMAAIDGAGARRVWFLIDDDDWRDLAGIAVVRAAADGNESREALEARLAAARAVLQRDKRCQIMGEGCSPWPEGLRGLPARPGRVLSARWLLVAVANKGDANTRSGLSIAEERRILAASLADLEVWWQPLAWHLPPLPGQRLRGQPFWTPGLALPLEDFQASDRFRDLEGDAR